MDKVFREPPSGDLTPIRHKEFNEFIKGKGFTGRSNYKLADLKAMFGFKRIITGSPVTISSDGMEQTRFDSISKDLTFYRDTIWYPSIYQEEFQRSSSL